MLHITYNYALQMMATSSSKGIYSSMSPPTTSCIASKVSSISIILGYLFGSTSRTEIFPLPASTGSLQSDLSKEIDLNPILSTK